MSKLFQNKVKEEQPVAMVRVQLPDIDDFTFKRVPLVGHFYRVIPKTGKEVAFLRCSQKDLEFFVPETGNGLLVSARLIDQFR
jgi:hypothetical protein|tara:strand:+ start:244 stop:492 length:249 start_codon:yes stop_codon:yes gene_type:complete